jgi:hypothetical protein
VIASVAARARLTEGQLYTCVITLVVAVLLSLGLGNVHGVASADLGAVAPLPGTSALPTPGPSATPGAVPQPGGFPTFAPLPTPAPGPTYEPVPEPGQPASTPTPSPSAPATPCDLQGVSDTGTGLVQTLDGLTGGALPEKDLLAAIGVITGCDPADPAVIAVGLLIGIGNTLPDPGIDPPVVPVPEIPGAVVTALQPARPAIDQVCGLVGTGATVTSLFISAYPRPVAPLVTQALFQALSVCGQLRTP